MRYRVWDIEDNKERTLENCITPLEVGTARRVIIRNGDTEEKHHFKVLEQLSERI